MRHALILALAALSACSGGKVVQDRPVRVAIPIPAPCAFTRPARPVPLKENAGEPQLPELPAARPVTLPKAIQAARNGSAKAAAGKRGAKTIHHL